MRLAQLLCSNANAQANFTHSSVHSVASSNHTNCHQAVQHANMSRYRLFNSLITKCCKQAASMTH